MRKLKRNVSIAIPLNSSQNMVEILQPEELVKLRKFDREGFNEGLSAVESATTGLYTAKNRTSSASGKYQYLYDTISKYIPYLKDISREEFLANPKLQEFVHQEIMDGVYDPDLKSPIQNGYDLNTEFLEKGIDLGLSNEEIGALSHFVGRKGARRALNKYVETGNLHFKPKTGINKYIDDYLKEFSKHIKRDKGEGIVPDMRKDMSFKRLYNLGTSCHNDNEGIMYLPKYEMGGGWKNSNNLPVKKGVVFSNNKDYTLINTYIGKFIEDAKKNNWDVGDFLITSGLRPPKNDKDLTRHSDKNPNSAALDLSYNLAFGKWSMLPEQIKYRKENELALLSPNHGTALHWHVSHKMGGGTENDLDISYGKKGAKVWDDFLKTPEAKEFINFDLIVNDQFNKTDKVNKIMSETKIQTKPNMRLSPYHPDNMADFQVPNFSVNSMYESLKQNQGSLMAEYAMKSSDLKQIEEIQRRERAYNMLSELGSMGYGIDDYLFKAGESAGFNIEDNHSGLSDGDKAKVKTANIVRGVGAGLVTLLGGARSFFGGMATAKAKGYKQQALAERRALAKKYDTMFFGEQGGVFKNVSDEQVFTGDYKIEAEAEPNAEVEGGERTQTVDGRVYEVKGSKHKNGGVPVKLEEGERILSDKRKIGKDLAKKLRDTLELKVYARTTYAEVIDKFESKIGINKLQKKQQEIFKEIEKNDGVEDENTVEQNLTYLSKKLKDIEANKKPLELFKATLFDFLWEEQEIGKGTLKREDISIEQAVEQSQEQTLREGVLLESESDETLNKFESGGYQKYSKRVHTQSMDNEKYAHQSFNEEQGVYDVNKDAHKSESERLIEYRQMFPELFNKFFDVNDGVATLREGKEWKDFQNNYNKYIDEQVAILEEEGGNQDIIDYLQGNKFVGGIESVRGVDNKNGMYTLSRSGYSKNMVAPETLQKLEQEGVYTISGLIEKTRKYKKEGKDFKTYFSITDEELSALEADYNKGLRYGLGSYDTIPSRKFGEEVVTTDKKEKEKVDAGVYYDWMKKQKVQKDSKVPDYEPIDKKHRRASKLFFPTQGRRLPRTLQIPELRQLEFDRVDMFKSDVIPYVIESQRNLLASTEALEGTNDSVNKLLIGSLAAQNQAKLGDAMARVAASDNQAALQRDQLNSNIEMKEDVVNSGLYNNWEEKTFAAQAATDLDIDNYFEALRKDRLAENLMQHQANIFSDMSENYNIGSFGEVDFDTMSSTEIYNRAMAEMSRRQALGVLEKRRKAKNAAYKKRVNKEKSTT